MAASYFADVRNYIEWAITTAGVLVTVHYGFNVDVGLWMGVSIFFVLATFDVIQHQLRGK